MEVGIYKLATVTMATAVVATALYIMAKGIGIVDGLDFGAGAYYYADIPDYEKINADGVFHGSVPQWVHFVLFFVWGFFMFKFWNWIDKK